MTENDSFTDEKVKNSVSKIGCKVIELDRILPVQRNIEIIKEWMEHK